MLMHGKKRGQVSVEYVLLVVTVLVGVGILSSFHRRDCNNNQTSCRSLQDTFREVLFKNVEEISILINFP